MKQVLQLPPWLYMVAFVIFQVGGSLLLRVASQRTGEAAVGLFFLGNAVGFCGATCLTLALRTEHPNLTFALCVRANGWNFTPHVIHHIRFKLHT